jgi:hypothetical protein
MTITDFEIDAFLGALDRQAKAISPYHGLPIWGDNGKPDEFRVIVREWLRQLQTGDHR